MPLLPDWLTGYDTANADAAAAADAALQKQNAIDYAPGGKFYTPANAAAVAADRNTELNGDPNAGLTGIGGYNVATQQAAIDGAFTDKLASEANSLVGTPLGIFWAEVKALLKALPWWLWVLLLIVPFGYVGGFGYLARQARAKLAK